MKICELPLSLQEKIKKLRSELKSKEINTPYKVCFYNSAGTRFFRAVRICREWRDDRTGNYMPFGGGTYWEVRYGEIRVRKVRDLIGPGFDVELDEGKTFTKILGNPDYVIPQRVANKKEVMAIKAKLETEFNFLLS